MNDACFERLAEWATASRFKDEIDDARRTYFDGAGLVHEDDHSFELRMASLSEFYLLDRGLLAAPDGLTPARLFLMEHEETLDEEARAGHLGLTRTMHGLFEIRRISSGAVSIRDVLTGEDHLVMERRLVAGMRKGDILEARLVPCEDALVFGRAFVCHPREARKSILGWAKRLRKAGELDEPEQRHAAVWSLARLALTCERHQSNGRSKSKVQLIYGRL